jgi:hypothetical protein
MSNHYLFEDYGPSRSIWKPMLIISIIAIIVGLTVPACLDACPSRVEDPEEHYRPFIEERAAALYGDIGEELDYSIYCYELTNHNLFVCSVSYRFFDGESLIILDNENLYCSKYSNFCSPSSTHT